MKITVLSIFPEIIDNFFGTSIMAKAVQKDIIQFKSIDIRDFALDKHHKCDDEPYGGGAGMVFKPEPVSSALDSIKAKGKRVIYPTPSGVPLTQILAQELSKEDELIFIAGRYEGLDQRVIDQYVTDEICIGDYVISSGELASLVVIDSVYRLIDGVIRSESLEEESFNGGLLEYPHYTRPAEFQGIKVPDVLLSGHHKNIQKWRNECRLKKTEQNRPDLFKKWLNNKK